MTSESLNAVQDISCSIIYELILYYSRVEYISVMLVKKSIVHELMDIVETSAKMDPCSHINYPSSAVVFSPTSSFRVGINVE